MNILKQFLVHILVVMCLALQVPALAQESSPAPWPPDPATIFEPNVKVSELIPTTPADKFPQFNINNDERFLSIAYSAAEKDEQFVYPKAIKNIDYYSKQKDGQLLLQVEETTGATRIWNLDAQTKIFTRYVAKCGQREPLYLKDVEDVPWTLRDDEHNHQTLLCETATGKLSSPLPDEMEWWTTTRSVMSDFPIEPSISPDGEWLVMFATQKNDPDYRRIFVYSYHILDDQLSQLGSFEADELFNFEGWVGTQILIYTSEMPEWSYRNIYIGDATKPNSLEYAVGRGRFAPTYQDDPPRFEFIAGVEGYDGPHRCQWVIYTIATRQLVTHDLGTMCAPEIGKLTSDAYYRDVPELEDGSRPIAYLVRYNALTGQRKELYSGEIESVEWISPDEHYAIMTLGTSGRVDRAQYLQSDFYNLNVQQLNLSYVDLVSKKVLFDIPAYWSFDGDWWLKSSIERVDGDTFLAIAYTDQNNGYASLFTFDGTQYLQKRLVDGVARQLGHYLLVWTDGYEYESGMSLYDIKTEQSMPIIRNIDRKLYRFEIDEVVSLDQFIVTVSNVPTTASEYHSVSYKVKIPGITG